MEDVPLVRASSRGIGSQGKDGYGVVVVVQVDWEFFEW